MDAAILSRRCCLMAYESAPGDRALVATIGLQRQTGTLLRKTRLPWTLRKGWVVSSMPGGRLVGSDNRSVRAFWSHLRSRPRVNWAVTA